MEFKSELYKFLNLIKEGRNFALVRLSDGENYILNGTYSEIEEWGINKDWSWKRDESHLRAREQLLNASLCDEENFYIGLPTHGGKMFFDKLKNYTKQREEYLTYACLFMDSNYKYFDTDMYLEFQKHEVIGVFHEKASLVNLGLNVIKLFSVGHAAYVNHLHIIDEMKKYIIENKIKNKLFLIAAGPFSNVLIYELFKLEKDNTYIDIGSALDNRLGFGITRAFLDYKNPKNTHPCINQYHEWYG